MKSVRFTNFDMSQEIMDVKDVCRVLNICRSTFDNRVKSGHIKVKKHFRKIYVLRKDLMAQLSISNVEPTTEPPTKDKTKC